MRLHPMAASPKISFRSKTRSHLTIGLAISILFVSALAFNSRKFGISFVSNAHTGPNSPPLAVADGPHTVHGTMVLPQVMTNDSDPDSDPVSFDIIASEPQHGHLTSGEPAGVIRYTVTTPGYEGPDSFTYRVRDSHGAQSNIATVAINVVNQAPIAANDLTVGPPISKGPAARTYFHHWKATFTATLHKLRQATRCH